MNMGYYQNPIAFNTQTWLNYWILPNQGYLKLTRTATCTRATHAFQEDRFIIDDRVLQHQIFVLKNGNYQLVISFRFKSKYKTIQNSPNLQFQKGPQSIKRNHVKGFRLGMHVD